MAKAQYVGVDGVAREVTKNYVGVSGVARNVTNGYVGVDGVAREFFSSSPYYHGGVPVSSFDVGDTVTLNWFGEEQDFIVVHSGNPSAVIYDSSCDGTWLLQKYLTTTSRTWGENLEFIDSNLYDYMDYCNGLPALEEHIMDGVKTVKIPYVSNAANRTVQQGSNGLSTQFFLLSGQEVGFMEDVDDSNLPVDGYVLDYFLNATNTTRKCYDQTVSGYGHWALRSPVLGSSNVFYVDGYGALSTINKISSVLTPRMAFILDNDTLV